VRYFQTFTKREGMVLTIAGRDAMIVGSRKDTVTLPMGTQINIEEALLFSNSTCTLLSYRDIRKNGIHMETHEENKEEFIFFSQRILDKAKRHLKRCPLSHLDCTT
jgi:peptide/histidine transporter 3/4